MTELFSNLNDKMLTDEQFEIIHESILEQLSTYPELKDCILTQKQYINNKGETPNMFISGLELGYNNNSTYRFINIRENVLSMFKKYKIINFDLSTTTEKHSELKINEFGKEVDIVNHFIKIVFMNIHGDTFGNIIHSRINILSQRDIWGYPFIFYNYYNYNGKERINMYLELFIKPFIKNYSMNSQYNLGVNKWLNYINPAYIDKMGQPEFIEYQYSDKIVPINVFDNFDIFIAKKYFPHIIFPLNFKMTLFTYSYLCPLYIPIGTFHEIFTFDGFDSLKYIFKRYSCGPEYTNKDGYIFTGKFINVYDYYYETKHKQKMEYTLQLEKKLIYIIQLSLQNKTTNETQTELMDEILPEPKVSNDYKYNIKNNVLTIFYYNHDELNLCDFLPLVKKDIEINKDGKNIIIKDCNCTNIERVTIICSNFKKITKYYQGIKYLQIMSCENQIIDIPKYLKKDLLIFTIDGKNQLENSSPPSYD